MAGAYENPQRLTGDTYAGAFSRGINQMNQGFAQQQQANDQEKKRAAKKIKLTSKES